MKIKRNFLKLASLFASLGTVAMSVVGATACGRTAVADAILVTDGGSVHDRSFNESSLDGLTQFRENNPGTKTLYIQVQDSSTATLQRAYEHAIRRLVGPKVLLGSGFLHEQNGGMIEFSKRHPDVHFLGVDFDKVPGDTDHPNFTGITFNSVQSGFLAAIYTGLYFNTSANTTTESKTGYYQMTKGETDIKAGIFGGLNIPAVATYMDGFLLGEYYFNSKLATLTSTNDPTIISGEASAPAKREFTPLFVNNAPSDRDFSGDFEPNNEKAGSIVDTLFAEGANFVFPVAGPQIGQAIAKAVPTDDKWVYGVDTDQTAVFTRNKDNIFGSAIKGIKDAVANKVEQIYKSEPGATNSEVYGLETATQPGEKFVGFIPNTTYADKIINGTKIDTIITTTKFFLDAETAIRDIPLGSDNAAIAAALTSFATTHQITLPDNAGGINFYSQVPN